MAKYRNRPDRRARRDVQQNICPVLSYTAAYGADNQVVMTFNQNVVLNGSPNLLLITPAGGIAANLVSAALTGPQQITLTFNSSIEEANKFLFVRDEDISIRGVTGSYASHEPRLILSV